MVYTVTKKILTPLFPASTQISTPAVVTDKSPTPNIEMSPPPTNVLEPAVVTSKSPTRNKKTSASAEPIIPADVTDKSPSHTTQTPTPLQSPSSKKKVKLGTITLVQY